MSKALIATAFFSSVINVLALGGSIFMLEVYDRVIPSKSIPTLVALLIIIIVVYAFNGFMEILRARLFSRVANVVDAGLASKVFRLINEGPLRGKSGADALKPSQDLDQIRSFLAGPGPVAMFDMPWMPVYLVICFVLHPLIGWLATAAMVLLSMLAVMSNWWIRPATLSANDALVSRNRVAEAALLNNEAFMSMGMNDRTQTRWEAAHFQYTSQHRRSSDVSSFFVGLSKNVRYLVQSGSLALGAYLVVEGEMSGGAIIAASVIVARALAPVEQIISSWRPMFAAHSSWTRLKKQFDAVLTEEKRRTQLPLPSHFLTLEQITVTVPGERRILLNNVSLRANAGTAIGVIGQSAAGKSTLLRVIAGVWPVARGKVTLDGANIEFWNAADRGRILGYLPQKPNLFPGTIAENIARLSPDADDEAILEAARVAGVHKMVIDLPDGYQTRVGGGGFRLSDGQEQRIALARALYGNPFLVVLDEPNSNLDIEGEAALGEAIKSVKARGGIVFVAAHRQSVVEHLDRLLVLENGAPKVFGPTAEILNILRMNAQTSIVEEPQRPQPVLHPVGHQHQAGQPQPPFAVSSIQRGGVQ